MIQVSKTKIWMPLIAILGFIFLPFSAFADEILVFSQPVATQFLTYGSYTTALGQVSATNTLGSIQISASSTDLDIRIQCYTDSGYTVLCGGSSYDEILNQTAVTGYNTYDFGSDWSMSPGKYYNLKFNQGGGPNTDFYGIGGVPYYKIYQDREGTTASTTNYLQIDYPITSDAIIPSTFHSFQLSGAFSATTTSRLFTVMYGRSTTSWEFYDEIEVSGGTGSAAGEFTQYVARTSQLIYPPLTNPQTYYAQASVYDQYGSQILESEIVEFNVSNNTADITIGTDATNTTFALGGLFYGWDILKEKYPLNWIFDTYDIFVDLQSTTTSYTIPEATLNFGTDMILLNTYMPTASTTNNLEITFFSSSTIQQVANLPIWPTVRTLQVWFLYIEMVLYVWREKDRLTKIS